MRTIAQKYIEQGEARGEARGRSTGIAIGEARGRSTGIAIGEARGKESQSLLSARKMLKKGVKIADIAEFTDLPIEQIKKLSA